MAVTITPTEADIFTAMGNVLQTFGLTASNPDQSVAIIRGQVNRVPEPSGQDFVIMWPLTHGRLAMNIDAYTPTEVIGSITGNVLTVSTVNLGAVAVGQTIFATGVTAGCSVLSFISGSTWAVSTTTNASGLFSLGTLAATQKTEVSLQLDVHGPASADNAVRIQALLRSQYGIDAFAAQSGVMAPLYTLDPRQIPFDNGEQQIEERWVVETHLQVDFTVTTPMQFAASLSMTAEAVEALSA